MKEGLRAQIEGLELDVRQRERRLADLRVRHAGLDVSTLAEFEDLTPTEQRRLYDADRDRWRDFLRQIGERGERRLAERQAWRLLK